MNEYQKQALNTIVEKAPDLLELLGKALRKGACIVDVRVELEVKQFDGRQTNATITLNGDVEWEM